MQAKAVHHSNAEEEIGPEALRRWTSHAFRTSYAWQASTRSPSACLTLGRATGGNPVSLCGCCRRGAWGRATWLSLTCLRRGRAHRRRPGLARHNARRYHERVIRGFRDSDTERLFIREPVRRFGVDVQRVALRRLRQLDAAVVLDDLRVPPGNRLEKLRGRRKDQFSIRVNDQWRVCFRWSEGDAYEVEIVDDH